MARPGYQIDSLTSTRAVAAIMVFIHHFGREVFPFSCWPQLFGSGNLAVSYFFVLSGFVLYIGYHDKNFTYGDFLKRRIARIVPVYEIALLIMVLFAVQYHDYYFFSHEPVKQVVYSALLIHAFIPSYTLILNLPGWTISVEMVFYMLFPLLLLLERKSFRTFATLTIILFMLSQYFHLKYVNQLHSLPDEIVDPILFSPEIHLSQFLVGMMAGKLFYKIKDSIPRIWILPLLWLAAVIAAIVFRPQNISYQVGLIAPLFAMLILSIAINDPIALKARFFVFLGEISYGIYILQFPLHSFLDQANRGCIHIPKQPFFWLSLIFVMAAAAASYIFIESPIRQKINALALKRRANKPAGSV